MNKYYSKNEFFSNNNILLKIIVCKVNKIANIDFRETILKID